MSPPPELTLWGAGTSRTLRVHWMIAEIGLDAAIEPIGPRTGETQTREYQSVNPKAKVPALTHGDRHYSESFAILRYLRRTFPLIPFGQEQKTPEAKAHYDELASLILMELDATSLYVIRRHADLASIYGEAPQAVSSARNYFSNQLSRGIPGETLGEFVWGVHFSELDIIFTTTLDWALAVNIDLSVPYQDYLARMHSRAGYRQALITNRL